MGGQAGRPVGRMRSGTECNCEALSRYAGPKWHIQMKIAMRKQEGKKRRDDSKTNHVRSPVAGDGRPVLLYVWDDLIPKVEIRHFFRGDCRRFLSDALCVEAVQRGDESTLYPVMTRETLGAVLSTVCAQELVVDAARREVLGQGHVELALCEPLKALVAMQHALVAWPWFAAALMGRHDKGRKVRWWRRRCAVTVAGANTTHQHRQARDARKREARELRAGKGDTQQLDTHL